LSFKTFFRLFFKKRTPPSDLEQAVSLLRAIERGGIPLHPAKINAIARGLGLDVLAKDPPERTIERIKAAVARVQGE
jgi:hypothetical protein